MPAVVLLPRVVDRVAVLVGRAPREGERRPQRDRVAARDGDDRRVVARCRDGALVVDRPALVGLAGETGRPRREVLTPSSTGTFVVAERAAVCDLEAGVVERSAAETGNRRRGARRQDGFSAVWRPAAV